MYNRLIWRIIGSSINALGGGNIHSFEYIISPENLLGAWREFKRGKNKKKDIQEFDFNLESNIFKLHNELKNKIYVNQPYTPFYVYDPKRRHIHKAQVRDRVVHQALYRVLYGMYDKHFIHDSYSCRVDKGTHRGVVRLADFTRKESKNYTKNIYVLKCDISKFFDSIDHKILKEILFKQDIDIDTIWLINKIIDSFPVFARSNPWDWESKNSARQDLAVKKGLPLGNVTSQLFANVYLNEFDQFIKHTIKAKYYIRYCDDFVIVSYDREYLESLISQISYFFQENLKLSLHTRKVEIRKFPQGIDFLGYVVLPHYKVLRTSTKQRILRKMKGEISENSKQSYLGILSHCKGYKIAQKIKLLKVAPRAH